MSFSAHSYENVNWYTVHVLDSVDCIFQAGMPEEALDACNKVLEVDENNIEALCDRAEAYIYNDQFDEGNDTR